MTSKLIKGLRNPRKAVRYLARQLRGHRRDLVTKLNRGDGFRAIAEDWDNLIILDACRHDVFAEVNDVDGQLEKRESCASSTYPFLEMNFDGCRRLDTVYISANAMVGKYDRREGLGVHKLYGLWGEETDVDPLATEVDDNTDASSLPEPGPVVERALSVHEEYPHKRLVVHFLPPHTPYIVKNGEKLPMDSKYRTFTAAREGRVSADEIRAVYRENVAYVLDHVENLVADLDGKTVVTADHGELLGESAIPYHHRLLDTRWPWNKLGYYDYAHYGTIRVPQLVEVPWLVLDHDERRNVTSADEKAETTMDESAIRAQLEALGYK